MLCFENYSLLAACQSVPEWSDITAVGCKFKLERTTCLVLCSSGVNKVVSLFPLRTPLCPWWHLALGREDPTHSKSPRGSYSLPNHNINLLGLNLQRWCLLPSSLQNDANRRQMVKRESVQDGTFHPVCGERGSQVNQSWKLRKEPQLSTQLAKRGGILGPRLHNQKCVVVCQAITSTPAYQTGSRGRRGKET